MYADAMTKKNGNVPLLQMLLRTGRICITEESITLEKHKSNPSSRNSSSKTHETLKALSRYLAGHPRVLWRYSRQEWTGKVWGLTDSNWAVCPATRKSTSATYLMLGKHPIFAANSTQTILSLSSGEAEFYGAVRCACRTLGLKSLMSNLSLVVKAELVTDSSACKGLCSRRGAGKIRHVHCPALWLQHAVARRQIAITRRAGKDLAPDVGTKAAMWCLDWPRAKVQAEAASQQAQLCCELQEAWERRDHSLMWRLARKL